MTPTEYITAHDPCPPACEWLQNYATVAEAWDACERPDWLLWAAQRLGAKRPTDATLRRIACRMVRETPLADGRKVWDLLKDERSRRAIKVAEAHSRGEATDQELVTARRAARRAANAATYAATYAAANAAANAVAWAYAAANAVAWAYAAANAAADVDATQCSIIREAIPNPFRP